MRKAYPDLARATQHMHVFYCGDHKLIAAADGQRASTPSISEARPDEASAPHCDDSRDPSKCEARYAALVAGRALARHSTEFGLTDELRMRDASGPRRRGAACARLHRVAAKSIGQRLLHLTRGRMMSAGDRCGRLVPPKRPCLSSDPVAGKPAWRSSNPWAITKSRCWIADSGNGAANSLDPIDEHRDALRCF